MKSIKLFGVREEDIPFINEWSEKHQVKVDLDSDILSLETVDRVKGFDGVSLSQQIELDEVVYQKLHDYGIKQIAQRSAGFDSYNLELAKQYELVITNVPSYSPHSIAEYTVSQALNLIRNFNDIQNKTAAYDFRWQPSILSRSIKDLKVAVIGTGRIGSIVGKIFAEGFGSEVVAYDIEPQVSCEAYLTYKESMREAIKDADIVTVHIPATLDTYEGEKGLFPSDQRNTQLDDAILIELIERQDVILSPHIAFYTDAAVKNLIVDALDATLEVIYTGDSKLRVN